MTGRARLTAAAALLFAGVAALAVIGIVRGDWGGEAGGVEAVERFDPDDVPFRERPRIEVLNAAGRPGLARTVTTTLRDQGFDVVFYGNARRGRDSSIVLGRGGDPRAARAVAAALDIAAVRHDPDTTLLLDATVVLGKDWSVDGDTLAAPEEVSWPVQLWRRLTR